MITCLILSIPVFTFGAVPFILFDVLRNGSVVDKTREDIEMIKKSVREMKSPVARTIDNYVIIPKSHLDERDDICTRASMQEKGIQFPGNGKDFEEVPSITRVKVGDDITSRKEEKYY